MGTRCNIIVRAGDSQSTRFIYQLYHHYDGGFSHVGKELCDYIESYDFNRVNTTNNNRPMYTEDEIHLCPEGPSIDDVAEDFTFWLNEQDDQYEVEEDLMWQRLHGDIEYLYTITFIRDVSDSNKYTIQFKGTCLYDSSISMVKAFSK